MGWSPNNEWVIYMSVTGYSSDYFNAYIKSVRAASLDGTTNRFLYVVSPHISRENIVGWTTDHSFVRYSSIFEVGMFNLEEIIITTGEQIIIIDSPFTSVALDPISTTLAVTIGEFIGGDLNIPFGIYFRFPGDMRAHLLLPGEYGVKWHPQFGQFSAGSKVIGLSGDVNLLPDNIRWISISPNGRYILSSGNAGVDLIKSDGEFQKHISNNRYSSGFFWLPDSSGFITARGTLIVFFEQQGWAESIIGDVKWWDELYLIIQ